MVRASSTRAHEALVGMLAITLGYAVLDRVRVVHAAPAPSATPAPSTATSTVGVAPDAPPGRSPTAKTAGTAGTSLAGRAVSVASYRISARLDPATHRIDGKETIHFVNRSQRALDELYFHLYLNAFKNDASMFLRSPFGEARSSLRASDWGYIDVTRCTAPNLGPGDLWPSHTPGTPEDPDDETDVRLPLPSALAPGGEVELNLEFSSKLPSVVLRTGHAGDFHFVAQWFPKLARLEDDGSFAHFPFHAQAEFYADYGDYDVSLDVPTNEVVGAVGRRVSVEANGERRIERYRAESVHDFAWTAWPAFRERKSRIGDVDVRLLYPPGYDRSADISAAALAFALPRASALYGAYPYPTLTVVHPPERAGEAGGMEYPTLIATGGPWYAGLFGDRAVESVTIHELLHEWFYGLVASNEARSPFLDEGLTSYAELRTLDAAYGPGSAFDGFGFTLSATSLGRVFAAARGEDLAVSSPAAAFPSFRTLGALVYSRTATLLETLARVYGRDSLEAALGAYARRYRFAHPTESDFLHAMGDALGPGVERTLAQALDERGHVNYLVREVQSAPERPAAGVFDRASGRETIASSNGKSQRYRGRAVILRHGELEFPVDIELTDAAGGRERRHWDGHGSLYVVDFRGTAPLTRVVIDPEHRVLIDDDLLDNAAAAEMERPRRVLERATYLAELVLASMLP